MHGKCVQGPGSDSSEDDKEEGPSTSAMSFPVQKNGMEMAVKFPSSSQRATALSTYSDSPENLQSPVTDSGNGISEDLCAQLGETSIQEWVERKVRLQKQRKPRRKRRQRVEVP